MTAASLVPVMATVTAAGFDVPSAATTVKVSLTTWPAASSSCAASIVYVQLPAASMLKVPYAPAVPACARKVAGESTSVIPSAPLTDCAALDSVIAPVSVEITAASLVPVMVTVTAAGFEVPSALVTVKVSVTTWPAASSSCAASMV